MEHERMRFRTMTLTALYARLGRITKMDKLERFISAAAEFGYCELKKAAEIKLRTMQKVGRPTIVVKVMKEKEHAADIKPIKRINKTEPTRRSLEF